MLGFLKHKPQRKEQRLEDQIERSESAFRMAMEAEQRDNPSAAEHFLRVAIREENKAFD